MLEININIRLNNTAVTSLFHGQKVNKMHTIQHSTQEILANGLGKTHKGKTSQRERVLLFLQEKLDSLFTVKI